MEKYAAKLSTHREYPITEDSRDQIQRNYGSQKLPEMVLSLASTFRFHLVS